MWLNETEIDQHVSTVEPYMLGLEPVKFITQVRDGVGKDVFIEYMYSKIYVKRPLSKRPKNGFQDQLLLSAGQKYCRMLQDEHSAILSTCIKLPIVIKIFVLSIVVAFLHMFFCTCTFQGPSLDKLQKRDI